MTKLQAQLEDLEKAFIRLKEACGMESTVMNQDATIKRYEFTFEMSWKVMQSIEKGNTINVYGVKNIIREAAKLDLIDDPADWFKFLEARNYTVHTYNEETAQFVYKKAKEFIPYVEELLIKAKNYL